VGADFMGMGVHEAARIAALAGGGEILASRSTVSGTTFRTSEPRKVTLKGISEAVEVVSVAWQ
jgi:class 3 adenylate cyclase